MSRVPSDPSVARVWQQQYQRRALDHESDLHSVRRQIHKYAGCSCRPRGVTGLLKSDWQVRVLAPKSMPLVADLSAHLANS